MTPRLVLATLFLLVSSNGLADWTRTSGPEGGQIRAVVVGQSVSLAATHQGNIHRNNGSGWAPVGSLPATRIISVGNTFLATTQEGLFRSVDSGSSWIEAFSSSSFPGPAVTTDGNIFYACFGDSIFKSLDEGGSWVFVNHVLNFTGSILAAGDIILIGSGVGMGLQRSSDGGTTFAPVADGLTGSGIVNSMEHLGGEFFVSFGQSGVFRSTNGGLSWELRSEGLPQFDLNTYYGAARMLALNAVLYAVTNTQVYKYNGASWSPASPGFMVYDIVGAGSTLLTGTLAGVWRSDDGGTNWTESNQDLVATTAKMFATIGNRVFSPISNRIARTTDNGTTWTYPGALEASRLVAFGSSLFAATFGGISRSTDNGTTWMPANQGITEYLPDIRDLAVTSDAVYASFYHIISFHGNSSWFSGGVYRSTNNGESWVAVNNGLPTNGFSVVAPTHRVAASGQSLFAATVAGVYRSTNAGASWIPAGSGIPSSTWVDNLYASPVHTLLGSNRGVFRFNGTAWEEMNNGFPQPNGFYPYAHSFVEHDGALFAATSAGVFRFDGTSWSQFGSGEPAESGVLSIIKMDGDLLASVSTKGVWRHTLATTAVKGGDEVPREFSLSQNYPNPFNPSTTFQFSVGMYGHTSLRVYDVLGREVATLVDEHRHPGSYSVAWDASDVSSGMYIATLTSGAYRASRKMVLSR